MIIHAPSELIRKQLMKLKLKLCNLTTTEMQWSDHSKESDIENYIDKIEWTIGKRKTLWKLERMFALKLNRLEAELQNNSRKLWLKWIGQKFRLSLINASKTWHQTERKTWNAARLPELWQRLRTCQITWMTNDRQTRTLFMTEPNLISKEKPLTNSSRQRRTDVLMASLNNNCHNNARWTCRELDNVWRHLN